MWSILFFFKQKTAYEVSTRDWSSDVCSSDLTPARRGRAAHRDVHGAADGQRPSVYPDLHGAPRSSVDRNLTSFYVITTLWQLGRQPVCSVANANGARCATTSSRRSDEY